MPYDVPQEWKSKSFFWFPHPKKGWLLGIKKHSGTENTVFVDFDKDEHQVPTEIAMKFTEITEHPSQIDLMSRNLLDLQDMMEGSVYKVVETRYMEDQIYTYIGEVLIACNPFKRIQFDFSKYIDYSPENISSQQPHCWATSARAFYQLKTTKQNQSVITSGESGAGKTETAKLVLSYLCQGKTTIFIYWFFSDSIIKNTYKCKINPYELIVASGKANTSTASVSEIAQAILNTNPILEALGNAKTSRNNNSSRFGKYMEILFNKNCDGVLLSYY